MTLWQIESWIWFGGVYHWSQNWFVMLLTVIIKVACMMEDMMSWRMEQSCVVVILNTHTHTQPFNGLCSGTTLVGRYQKKHSPTHTHPDHRTSFINFLHLLLSTASLFHFTCLAVLFNNLSPGPLWSSSWSWTLCFILHVFLHPVIIFS